MIQMNFLTNQRETHRLRKQTDGYQGEGIVSEFGKVMYTLLYSKWITNEARGTLVNVRRHLGGSRV